MSDYINKLPNELLLHTFDRVPLSDLLRLDKVCPKWKVLLPDACARRRTLVLIGSEWRLEEMDVEIPFNEAREVSFSAASEARRPFFDLPASERASTLTPAVLMPNGRDDDEEEEEDNDDGGSVGGGDRTEEDDDDFARFCFSAQLVTYLTERFPKVNKLVVIHPQCDEAELQSVIELIGFWSLEILKVWIRTDQIDKDYLKRRNRHPVGALLDSIARQSSLQQLTLDLHGDCRDFNYAFPSDSYTFIGQLNKVKICLGNYDRGTALWRTFHRFDHAELRHIGLGSEHTEVKGALKPDFTELAAKVRELYCCLVFDTVRQLDRFCPRFGSLTSLHLLWQPTISFTRLVANLAALTQLTYLKLRIKLHRHPENVFAFDGAQVNGNGPISLPQIKVLDLTTWAHSHHYFESLSPLVFPSVEVIILEQFLSECTTCRPYITTRENSNSREWKNRCHRLWILSAKRRFVNPLVRLYAIGDRLEDEFVDWTDYVATEDDVLPEIGERDDDVDDNEDDDEDDDEDYKVEDEDEDDDEDEDEDEEEDEDEFDEDEDDDDDEFDGFDDEDGGGDVPEQV